MRGQKSPWAGWTRAVVALLLGTSGCSIFDNLLVQEPHEFVLESQLLTPGAVPLLVRSMVADFECALPRAITAEALLWDEYMGASANASQEAIDARNLSNGFHALLACPSGPGVNKPLHVARYDAEQLDSLLETLTDAQMPAGITRKLEIGRANIYAGYATILLGEYLCTVTFNIGPELPNTAAFTRAEAHFDKAITVLTEVGTPEANDLINFARVGRARVRLDLKRPADARADALLVPTNFVKNATMSGTLNRTSNTLYQNNVLGNVITIGPKYRNVRFNGVPDPRVSVVNTGLPATNTVVPWWKAMKYPAVNTPVPIATWREARLIVAEGEWAAQNYAAAVAIINELHSRAGVGLPAFASTDPTAIYDQIKYERRAELFLEGQAMWDQLRWNEPLDPAPNTPHHYGGVYGSERCFPLSDTERFNNPNTNH
jgi:hypothetical protein